MRINLKVPFSQKEAAKELGARWDAARKIWYVVDPQCLEVLSDWMPQEETLTSVEPQKRPSAVSSPAAVTGTPIRQPSCGCDVLPWEHCEHSMAQAS